MYFAVLSLHFFFFYYKILELITDSLYETWFSPAKMIPDSILIIYVSILINFLFPTFAINTHRMSLVITKNHFRRRKFCFSILFNWLISFVHCKWALHDFSFRSIIGKASINQWPIRFDWYAFYSVVRNALEMNVFFRTFRFSLFYFPCVCKYAIRMFVSLWITCRTVTWNVW